MPGAWEISPRVAVGVLHVEQVTFAWALGLRRMQGDITIIPISGQPFDHARNSLCQATIEHNFDYILHLDSDVIPPPDVIPRLIARGEPIVSGLYCRRSIPHAIPVAQKNGQWVTQFTPGSMFEVDVVGAGCLLIRRDVLLSLPPIGADEGKQWFHWRVDRQSIPVEDGIPHMSEDFTFCHHARKNGYRVMLDTSVVCKHVGLAEATFNQFQPITYG